MDHLVPLRHLCHGELFVQHFAIVVVRIDRLLRAQLQNRHVDLWLLLSLDCFVVGLVLSSLRSHDTRIKLLMHRLFNFIKGYEFVTHLVLQMEAWTVSEFYGLQQFQIPRLELLGVEIFGIRLHFVEVIQIMELAFSVEYLRYDLVQYLLIR